MEGCKQMGHFLNLSNYREAFIQPLKVNSPETKKPLAARGAQKCLTVTYPWFNVACFLCNPSKVEFCKSYFFFKDGH